MTTRISNKQVQKGNRILVVDDCDLSQVIAQQYLERAGYQVESAENGQQALEVLKDNQFDLILMDLVMPVMDGYEAARRIRNSECGMRNEEHRMWNEESRRRKVEGGMRNEENRIRNAECGMRNENIRITETKSEMPGANHKCACRGNKDQAQKHACSKDDCKCRRAEADQDVNSAFPIPHSAFQPVPIIGMSGHDPKSVMEECCQAGMNDCIGKPLQGESLVAVVRKWIAGESDSPLYNSAKEELNQPHPFKIEKQAPIDIEKTITEFMGKTGLLGEVLNTFKTKVRAQIMNIKQHISVKNFDPILSEAHSIKGGAGNLGALNLSQAAAELEEAAGEESSSRANAAIDDLENEFQRLYQYIEQSDMGKAISK